MWGPADRHRGFLSTPSARRATAREVVAEANRQFLSTPSARRATHQWQRCWWSTKISIHALREEGDYPVPQFIAHNARFLSTPSARRATQDSFIRQIFRYISIHALREEGDQNETRKEVFTMTFLSTPSARRATTRPLSLILWSARISIHALREEGDRLSCLNPIRPRYFYPRPPRGGRLFIGQYFIDRRQFLSTPSARRATLTLDDEPEDRGISIHALREEGDATSSISLMAASIFLSTPSARRATSKRPRTKL